MDSSGQIADVLVRYATAIDSRDWNLFRSCFTEDCKLDYGELGRWENREAVTRFMMASHSGPSLHRLGNFTITIEGKRANARSYIDVLVYGPGFFGAHSVGYYDDELVCTDQGWKIARRRLTGVRMKLIGIFDCLAD